MDYGQLAQLSAPGQSPLTSGVVDPMGYNRWQNLAQMQQDALIKAQPLADMDLQKQQQMQQEYMAGASGRRDLITLGNQKAGQALADFPEDQVRAKLEKELQDAEKRKKLSDFSEDIAKEADGYVNSDKEEDKAAILSSLQGRTVRMGPGKTHTFGQDPQRDRVLLMAAGIGRKNEPKLANKLDVVGTQGQYKVANTAMAANFAAQRAALDRDVRLAVANINAKAKSNKPLSVMEQALAMAYGDGKEIVDVDGAMKALQFEIAKRTAAGEMKLDNTAATVSAILTNKPLPQGATPPAVPEAREGERKPKGKKTFVPFSPEAMKLLEVGGVFDGVVKSGKEIKGRILGINPETGQLNIEGVGVVEVR